MGYRLCRVGARATTRRATQTPPRTLAIGSILLARHLNSRSPYTLLLAPGPAFHPRLQAVDGAMIQASPVLPLARALQDRADVYPTGRDRHRSA